MHHEGRLWIHKRVQWGYLGGETQKGQSLSAHIHKLSCRGGSVLGQSHAWANHREVEEDWYHGGRSSTI